jgi:hypothetical protein
MGAAPVVEVVVDAGDVVDVDVVDEGDDVEVVEVVGSGLGAAAALDVNAPVDTTAPANPTAVANRLHISSPTSSPMTAAILAHQREGRR